MFDYDSCIPCRLSLPCLARNTHRSRAGSALLTPHIRRVRQFPSQRVGLVLPSKRMRMHLLHLGRSSDRDADAKGNEMADDVDDIPSIALIPDIEPKGQVLPEPEVYATTKVVAA